MTKKMILAMVVCLMTAISSEAMNYSSARNRALFLTDKMAYELNLSDDQYNAAYEINLDYFMNISSQNDLYGYWWKRRNQELSYVLSTAQYSTFMAAEYFYRPLAWVSNRFTFLIYNRYPNRNKFYRSAPTVYSTYRGGNAHYSNSPYKGRSFGNGNQKSNIQSQKVSNDRNANQGSGNSGYRQNQKQNEQNTQDNGKQGHSTNQNFGQGKSSNGQQPTLSRREAIRESKQQSQKR